MTVLDLEAPHLPLTVRFRLVDSLGNPTSDELHPSEERPPTLTNDTERTLKRTLTGLLLPPAEADDLDPLTARVQPYVYDGQASWPLGVFLFADYPRSRTSAGRAASASLVDQGRILDQDVTTAFNVAQGANLGGAIAVLLDRFGIFRRSIEGTNTAAGQGGLTWPAGTKGTVIANELARQCGFLPLYWDSIGIAVVRTVPVPDVSTPTFVLRRNVRARTVIEADVPLDVPNTYVVIDNGVTVAPIVVTYRVPASAPHSVNNLGYEVTRVIHAQGLGSTAAALQLAAAAADEDIHAYQQVSLQTPLDPRHDTFDVVQWVGTNYLERRWTAVLHAHGPMQHDLVRIYR